MIMDFYKSKMKLFNDTYVMYQLLEFIDENSIICLCKASKKLNEICKQYIELEDDKRFYFEIYGNKSAWHNSKLLEKFCENNDIIKVRKMIKVGYFYLGFGLYGACKGGHIDIVKFMIKEGNNNCYWNGGLYGACEGGHIDIVKLMIEKGANDWNKGLYYACQGGHINIVTLMVEKGADQCVGECWHCNKSIKEHSDIDKLMHEKGAYECVGECWDCRKSIEKHFLKSEKQY